MFLCRIFLLLNFIAIPGNKDKVIAWRPNVKLSWSDFKGPLDIYSDAAAVTSSGITFSYSLEKSNNRILGFNALVQAHFYPEHSWFNGNKVNNHILAHEQLHFDITELHVRLLRYKISRLKLSQNIKKELDQLHKQAKIEMEEMQLLYDSESRNSTNKELQMKWEKFVHEKLEELDAFASPN